LARSDKNLIKEYEPYRKIADDYRKSGVVARSAKFNESFAVFIDSLPALDPVGTQAQRPA
jgi:hypothetical protein